MCITANKERNTPSKYCKKIAKSRPQPRDAMLIKYEKIYGIKIPIISLSKCTNTDN